MGRGVRGIVVGDVLRRLGRTIAQQVMPVVERFTAPFQYALKTRAGTECVAHQCIRSHLPSCNVGGPSQSARRRSSTSLRSTIVSPVASGRTMRALSTTSCKVRAANIRCVAGSPEQPRSHRAIACVLGRCVHGDHTGASNWTNKQLELL